MSIRSLMVIMTLLRRAPSLPRALNTPLAFNSSMFMPCILSNTVTMASIVLPSLISSANSPFCIWSDCSIAFVLLWMLVNTLLKAVADTSGISPMASLAEPRARS